MANRHRPRTWDDVCGQEGAIRRLQGMLKDMSLPNAIMLAGPSGTGKTTLARVLARYINCENLSSCGECPSCKAMDARSHPDYEEVNCANARGIDEMRALLGQAKFLPMHNIRVVVLDEFQQITPQAAQAALKMLEEPPESTLFIICTMEPEKVQPAVVGRCQLLQTTRVPAEDVATHLARISKAEGLEALTKKAYLSIAEATGGQLRNALQTLDAVMQAIRGMDEELEGEELDKLILETVISSSGVADEQVATKALFYLHAQKIKGKACIRGVLKCLLDVQNPVAFINSMMYQNSYLLDCLVDAANPGIYHTAVNQQLVKLLNSNVEHTKGYGDKPSLSACLAIQAQLLDVRQKLVSISNQDKAILQVGMAAAFQDASQYLQG